jgi:hypothetical protein
MTSTFNFPDIPDLRRRAVRVVTTMLLGLVFSLGVQVTLAQELTQAAGADAAPTGLSNEDGIFLTWEDNSHRELGFEIQMRDEDGAVAGTFQTEENETRFNLLAASRVCRSGSYAVTVTALMPDGSRLVSDAFRFNTGILECQPNTPAIPPTIAIAPQLPRTGRTGDVDGRARWIWWLAIVGAAAAVTGSAVLTYRRKS